MGGSVPKPLGGPFGGPLGYPPDRIDVLQPDLPDHEEPEQDLCSLIFPDHEEPEQDLGVPGTALENPHGANRDLTEGPFYRFSAPPRFHTTKTPTGLYRVAATGCQAPSPTTTNGAHSAGYALNRSVVSFM
jgi:hypothetical protein